MSARRATPADVRCVWLTQEQITMLEDSLPFYLPSTSDVLHECIVNAWEDAPADPAEAVRARLARYNVGSSSEEVLVALGFPGGSPRQETPT